MPGVTVPSEKPGSYKESFAAIKEQMLKQPKINKKFSDKEIDVMIKKSLIQKAEDKIEFMLRGEVRRKKLEKMGVSEDEYRAKMKKRLKEQDGYPFELTKEEKELAEAVEQKTTEEAIKEKTNLTAEALKKILAEV